MERTDIARLLAVVRARREKLEWTIRMREKGTQHLTPSRDKLCSKTCDALCATAAAPDLNCEELEAALDEVAAARNAGVPELTPAKTRLDDLVQKLARVDSDSDGDSMDLGLDITPASAPSSAPRRSLSVSPTRARSDGAPAPAPAACARLRARHLNAIDPETYSCCAPLVASSVKKLHLLSLASFLCR